jgi:glutathione peroxidase
MRKLLLPLLLLCSAATLRAQADLSTTAPTTTMDSNTVYQFTLNTITGEPMSLEKLQGKVLLIVNVASECGYTPQYEGLQSLYETYEAKGLVILGIPANNFGGQEPGSDEEIQQFCTSKFHVTFPMFSKIEVKGEEEHPLYTFLTQQKLNGVLDAEVKWNFNKFLIGRNGKVVQWFPSKVKPDDAELISAIEALL